MPNTHEKTDAPVTGTEDSKQTKPPQREKPAAPTPEEVERKQAQLHESLRVDFDQLLQFMQREFDAGYLSVYRLWPITSLVLDTRVSVGNASRYIYVYARRQGYDIPPHPLSSSGELRKFLADEGVENIPEWYEKIGITEEEYVHLHDFTLIEVRGRYADRIAILIPLYLPNWPNFVPLQESGIASELSGPQMISLLDVVTKAALSEDSTPSTNPTVRVIRYNLKDKD